MLPLMVVDPLIIVELHTLTDPRETQAPHHYLEDLHQLATLINTTSNVLENQLTPEILASYSTPGMGVPGSLHMLAPQTS